MSPLPSPCGFDGSLVEPFWVQDSKLVACSNPFSDGAACLRKAADRQVDQLGCGVIGWETAARFGCFADDSVQAFNSIRGVDDFAHGGRKGKERDDLLPGTPPARGD